MKKEFPIMIEIKIYNNRYSRDAKIYDNTVINFMPVSLKAEMKCTVF